MRQRNTVLAALELFRDMHPGISVNSIVAFHYVAENEGLNGKELAQLCRLLEPTTSRSLRALASPGSPHALPPSLGLVDLYQGDAGRLIVLTEKGRKLRDQIDELIARGDRISANARPLYSPATDPARGDGAQGLNQIR